MDKEATPTNSSESLTIPFAGQMLSIYEPAPGKVRKYTYRSALASIKLPAAYAIKSKITPWIRSTLKLSLLDSKILILKLFLHI